MIRRLRIEGLVQGVGFRPFAARVGRELGLTGSVRNDGGVVVILLDASDEMVERFIGQLHEEQPAAARIDQVTVEETNERPPGQEGFVIVSSTSSPIDLPVIPPDLPTCERCLAEMRDPADRRYRYPFISCTDCGPRYSILRGLPYDRERTAMDVFPLCSACAEEYESSARRCYAQTIGCPQCGPILLWQPYDPAVVARARKTVAEGEDALRRAIAALRRGEIIALKGIGGYQLVCRPDVEEALRALRRLKQREEKPFAVMFPDVDQVRQRCVLCPEEEEFLCSDPRPIVLLDPLPTDAILGPVEEPVTGLEAWPRELVMDSRFCGAFLPCSGLHQILVDELGPLVVTSANLSESPIMIEDDGPDRLFSTAGMIAADQRTFAGCLYHKREILAPLDDSVGFVCEGRRLWIRRARGAAPVPVELRKDPLEGLPEEPLVSALLPRRIKKLRARPQDILAMGGDLKAVFGLGRRDKIYLSQPFGDLVTLQSETAYLNELHRLSGLLELRPALVVTDLHPRYISAAEGRRLAKRQRVKVLEVQHHHAHIASVMAEHGLERCLGFAFDGTGFGTDGGIWGGEVLYCEGCEVERVDHLRPVGVIGGDYVAKNAFVMALCVYLTAELRVEGRDLADEASATTAADGTPYDGPSSALKEGLVRAQDQATLDPFGEEELIMDADGFMLPRSERISPSLIRRIDAEGDTTLILRSALHKGKGILPCTSMGRLFDAVAATLGLARTNSYEAHCAILLENQAALALKRGLPAAELNFDGDPVPLVTELAERVDAGESVPSLALGFHLAVADWALRCALDLVHEKKAPGGKTSSPADLPIALSGGVFANRVLLKACLERFEGAGFKVYINEQVPAGDGGIALGQIYLAKQIIAKETRAIVAKKERAVLRQKGRKDGSRRKGRGKKQR